MPADDRRELIDVLRGANAQIVELLGLDIQEQVAIGVREDVEQLGRRIVPFTVRARLQTNARLHAIRLVSFAKLSPDRLAILTRSAAQ